MFNVFVYQLFVLLSIVNLHLIPILVSLKSKTYFRRGKNKKMGMGF